MAKTTKNQWAERIFLLFVLCASLFLFLANLGNQYLWQDEAQTAVISRTILTHGVPVGYDGKNYFSQELKSEYGKNYIWKWHTWLPFYLLAAFFKLFGTCNQVQEYTSLSNSLRCLLCNLPLAVRNCPPSALSAFSV